MVKWYNYFNRQGEENLVDSVEFFNDISNTLDDENLLVCQQLKNRKYAKFKNFAEFSKYFHSCPEEEKCFYEMMRKENARKPYFDIDIDDVDIDYKNMISEMKKNIIAMIGENIRLLVFDSSTEIKKSFHIIVDLVYLESYKELIVFFDMLKNKISEKYKKFIDKSVYKSIQQFRIYKSHKYLKNNIKEFRKDLSYNFSYPENIRKKEARFNYLLSSSLVTNISGCRILCGFQEKVEEKEIQIFGSSSEGDIEDIMNIFYQTYSYGDFSFYECKEKNGNLLIVLKRLNPTFCKMCNRIHENENPFITVVGEYRHITFYCRRKEEKFGHSLGTLGIPNFEEIKKIQPPVIEDLETLPSSTEEEPYVENLENIEDILEDICEIKSIYTPGRKNNIDKSLNSLSKKNFLY